jgi:predicted small lipoprotein YifL
MKKVSSWIVSFLLVCMIAGCGPRYYIPADKDKPGEIVVSAYTQEGCLEELQEEAKAQNVEVKLRKIETDLGWEILLFPFYKGYRCIGEVIGPAKK